MTDALAALTRAGVSIWLDDLSRERLVSGSLADLAEHDLVTGVRLVADHGVVRADSVRPFYADGQQALDGLREVGVDYDDVVQTLEDNGVAAFDAAWARLGERLAATLSGTPAQLGG